MQRFRDHDFLHLVVLGVLCLQKRGGEEGKAVGPKATLTISVYIPLAGVVNGFTKMEVVEQPWLGSPFLASVQYYERRNMNFDGQVVIMSIK